MREARSRSTWQAIAREPLVHFVAIGLVLFAVDAWRAEPPPRAAAAACHTPSEPDTAPAPSETIAPRAPIVIDARVEGRIVEQAERHLGRRPTAAELAAETERWIDEEILYREALARRLDRDDPMIHQRIASRMSYVLEQGAIVPEPDDAELRRWFEAHRAQWTLPERVDFVHVFVAGEDTAAQARRDQLAAALAAGAAPERLGDAFTGGHRYRGRKLADLALTFGDGFAAGLDSQAPGTWQPRRSRFGLHLVRVDRIEASRPADFATARLDVRKAWMEARRDLEVGAALARVRAGWEIVRP